MNNNEEEEELLPSLPPIIAGEDLFYIRQIFRAKWKVEVGRTLIDLVDIISRQYSAAHLSTLALALPYEILAAISALVLLFGAFGRMRSLFVIRFIAKHGYNRKWKVPRQHVLTSAVTSAKVHHMANQSGLDHRIIRDVEESNIVHLKITAATTFFVILPWLSFNLYLVIFAGIYDTAMIIALTSSAISVGSKLNNLFQLVLLLGQNSSTKNTLKSIYEPVPSEIDVATGASVGSKSTKIAATEAWNELLAKLIGDPHFVIVSLTANHDIDEAISTLLRLSSGNTVFVGGTTCQGIMKDGKALNKDDTVLGLFGVYDTDGVYVAGSADYTAVAGSECFDVKITTKRLVRKLMKQVTSKTVLPECGDGSACNLGGPPGFVFCSPTPGNEDVVLATISSELEHRFMTGNKHSVPIVGGTSADNKVAGKWKSFATSCASSAPKTFAISLKSGIFGATKIDDNSNSSSRINNTRIDGYHATGKGLAICIAWPSVIVKSAFYSGYSATSHTGVVTKVDPESSRHILEIDNKPAASVYRTWVAGALEEPINSSKEEDVNILAPSSFFPLAQVQGKGVDGYPAYRIMHPHLVKLQTNSLTLFADVKAGQRVTLMTGTSEHIINRVSQVMVHLQRDCVFDRMEAKGAFTVYCGGCMMAVKSDIGKAASRLRQALNGIPIMTSHAFGEQGKFPDGTSLHGNLMFSALIFSNRRLLQHLLNLDTGEEIIEFTPEYEEIIKSRLVVESNTGSTTTTTTKRVSSIPTPMNRMSLSL